MTAIRVPVAVGRAFGHQEWIPLSVRTKVLTQLYDPERLPAHAFEVDFFDLRYPGDLSSFLDWHVYFFGAYAKDELELLGRLLQHHRPGGVFIDIGANVGQHTIFMSRIAAQVHAFEPWAPVREKITEKVARNNLTNVTVHPVAIGTEPEALEYYAPLGANMATGSFSPAHATDRNRPAGQLDVVNGDEYFAEHGITEVDLVKIDVEGWEKHVVDGLRQVITQHRPVVFMEYTSTTQGSFADSAEFEAWLPAGYLAVAVETTGPKAVARPFAFDEVPANVILHPGPLPEWLE